MHSIIKKKSLFILDALKCGGVLKSVIVASALALGLITQPAQAALTFTFNYSGAANEGFNHATHGTARQAALNDAANMLGAYFTNYTANLTFDVYSYNDNTSSTLASAGSSASLVPNGFERTVVQNKIISGTDSNNSEDDGYIEWNFAYDWGLTDNVAAGEFDLKSTAMHELMHAFGFLSFIYEDGSGLGFASYGTNTWSIYDQFLTDAAGKSLISSDGVFGGNTGALTSGVLFNGTNAMAANGGIGVDIFAPNPWDEGSSISHVDDSSMLMYFAGGYGDGVRTLSEIEQGILKDIGYTDLVNPVPVPAAVWLMSSGLIALFGFNRRRRVG
jgi:hypothetical protein